MSSLPLQGITPPSRCEAPGHAAGRPGSSNPLDEGRLLGQLRLLNQLAQAAAGNLELAPILEVALRELDRHLPMHISAVWLVSEPGLQQPTHALGAEAALQQAARCHLVLTAVSEQADELDLQPGVQREVEETPFGPCLESGTAFYADLGGPEAQTCPLLGQLAARGAVSCVAVPLRTGDRTVGILQSICTRPSGVTAEQIQLLYLVADLLGPAVSNCGLFGRLRTAYDELRRMQHQLVQTEKMRALGELAGGMAHEFNNALCGALGFMELALLSDELTPACRSYLESARTCAQDAAHTVRRVQDFARQQPGGMATQVIALDDLVRQTIELIRHKWDSLDRARSARVQVVVDARASGCVSGNSAELREVITNLVFNAVDAMPEGGTICVRTWSTPRDLFLAVQDTGVGIDETVRQRLFEPFFTTKGERGNGLGLSVTFAIVRRHNGEIDVDSRVGKGTTFTVRLPAHRGEGGPEDGAHVPAAPAEAVRRLRILVIEDEEPIRRFLDMALRQLGHDPRLTANGREGLETLADERFDVVLTDLGMPEVSGDEVARQVAQRAPGTPVVLLTGWGEQLEHELLSINGVAKILNKPVALSDLSDTLRAVAAAPDSNNPPSRK